MYALIRVSCIRFSWKGRVWSQDTPCYLIRYYLPCMIWKGLVSGPKPGIPNTKRSRSSTTHGIQLGLGGAYRHWFINIYLDDLVRWYRLMKHDCVWGGSYEDLYWSCSNE